MIERSTTGRKNRFRLRLVPALAWMAILVGCATVRPSGAEHSSHQIVVLSDLHLPGTHGDAKVRALEVVDSWSDVELVAAVGDLCQDVGTDEEYAAVSQFFGRLHHPLRPVTGNHDYLYAGHSNSTGKRVKGSPADRSAKLRLFREKFGLDEVFYAQQLGGYLLIFLSVDHLQSNHLTEMSDGELSWLNAELNRNRRIPTIVFFHAPLQGTLLPYNQNVNGPDMIAQPAQRIRDLLADNPQVFLWVSGHTHTTPNEPSFASPVNLYDGRVTNLHNADMNRAKIWTRSFFLYPDKVVVRTYDHHQNAWLPELDRTVPAPVPRRE